MPRTKPIPIRISTRAILIGVLLFNFIAIGLSEVQRRALIYRTQNLISGLERTLSVQGKHLASMNASVGALSILIQNGHFASKQEIETRIEQSLVEGKSVVIRFDDSKLEWRDADGAIRCGLEASQSFLGIFVAGEEYRISYDKQNQKWTGAGPTPIRGQSSAPIDILPIQIFVRSGLAFRVLPVAWLARGLLLEF